MLGNNKIYIGRLRFSFFFLVCLFLLWGNLFSAAVKSKELTNKVFPRGEETATNSSDFTNRLRIVLANGLGFSSAETVFDHFEYEAIRNASIGQWELTPFVILNTNREPLLSAATLSGKLNAKTGGFLLLEQSRLGSASLKFLEKCLTPVKREGPVVDGFDTLDLTFLLKRLGGSEGTTEMNWSMSNDKSSLFTLKETIKPHMTFLLEAELFTNHLLHPSRWAETNISKREMTNREINSFLDGSSIFASLPMKGIGKANAIGEWSSSNLSVFRLAADLGLTNGLVPFLLYQPVIPKQVNISAKANFWCDGDKKKIGVKDAFFEIKPLLRFDLESSYVEIGEGESVSNRLEKFSLVVSDLGVKEVLWTLAGNLWGCDRQRVLMRLPALADQVTARFEQSIGRQLNGGVLGFRDFLTSDKKNKLEVKMDDTKLFFFRSNTPWTQWFDGLMIL